MIKSPQEEDSKIRNPVVLPPCKEKNPQNGSPYSMREYTKQQDFINYNLICLKPLSNAPFFLNIRFKRILICVQYECSEKYATLFSYNVLYVALGKVTYQNLVIKHRM